VRARYPDTEGFVERDGVKVAYEVGSVPDDAERARETQLDRRTAD
jgi:hypothetical protein